MGLGHHLTFRLTSGAVLFRTAAARRRAARIILDIGARYGLFAFRAPDTHLHVGLATDRAAAGRFAQAVAVALRPLLPPESVWESARIRPIDSQRHLENALRYILDQAAHHATLADPLAEASNVPDLLRLRVTGAYTIAAVRELVPRFRVEELWPLVGVERPEAPAFDLASIADATPAAVSLPALTPRLLEARSARIAAYHLGRGQAPTGVLDECLGVHRGVGARLRARSPSPALVQAIGLQCALRRSLRLATSAVPTWLDGPIEDVFLEDAQAI